MTIVKITEVCTVPVCVMPGDMKNPTRIDEDGNELVYLHVANECGKPLTTADLSRMCYSPEEVAILQTLCEDRRFPIAKKFSSLRTIEEVTFLPSFCKVENGLVLISFFLRVYPTKWP